MMPIPWKRTEMSSLSRFFSGIRSKRSRSSSSLLVQTGFPTSLADLVVKHRSRYRSKRRRPPSSSPSFASLTSQIIAVIEASHLDTDGATRKPEFDFLAEIIEEEDPTVVSERSIESERQIFDYRGEQLSAIIPPSSGVRFQAKVVLVMALAVCTKELVFGVMFSAFVLLLLESVGWRIVVWANLGGEGSLYETQGIVQHENRGVPSSAFLERREFARAEIDRVEEVVTSKLKMKHWTKVVGERFRGWKHGKDAKEHIINRCSSHRGASHIMVGAEEEVTLYGQLVHQNEEGEGDGNKDVCEDEKNGCEQYGNSLCHVLLCVVVLSGLVGGKIIAFVITLGCCFLMKASAFTRSNRRIMTSCCSVASDGSITCVVR